jgi:hypothetical protein
MVGDERVMSMPLNARISAFFLGAYMVGLRLGFARLIPESLDYLLAVTIPLIIGIIAFCIFLFTVFELLFACCWTVRSKLIGETEND